ncbi:phosphate/phosphite/phosphonate ABC transporter substrate-binding protein [Marinobacterium sp. YM272]|uniref:phosphate/phosphite/phosphonate ABC transporter substrate-binding protein n=1 Tax=Marinobacterium sp. YM272 TaxID=3421654 RepID=UPI003D7FDBC2
MIKIALLAMALWVQPVLAAQQDSCAVERLHFSMVPKADLDGEVEIFANLAALLSSELDIPVDIVRPVSYESVVRGVVDGGLDMAVLGPASYVRAHEQNDRVEAFASISYADGVFTPEGAYYQSILIVRGDSNYQQVDQLQGASVAFTDPGSTSGELIPSTQFARLLDMPLDRFFASRIYAGSHDRAMEALLSGQVAAAFVSSRRADDFLDQGIIGRDSFRVLWRSEPIHFDPFVFGSKLCEPMRRRISELMLSGHPGLQAYLDSEGAEAIIPVDNDAYRPIAELSR